MKARNDKAEDFRSFYGAAYEDSLDTTLQPFFYAYSDIKDGVQKKLAEHL